jgi:hypothetical protein
MESKNGWTAMELTEGGCRRRRRLQTWRWERRSDSGGGQNVTDKSRGRRQLGLGSFPRGVEKSNGGSSHDDLAPKRCSTTDNAVGEWVAELEAGRGVTLATGRVMGGAAWWEQVAVAVVAYNTLVEERRRRQGC